MMNPSKIVVFVGALVAAIGFVIPQARAEHVRMSNPNVAGVEVLGRGLLYSAFFDRVVSDDLAAGIGIGTTKTQDLNGNDASKSATLIPAYANFYFNRDQGSLYATGGVTLITNSSDVSNLKSTTGAVEFGTASVLPTFGLGYENRSDAGFLVRFTGYGIVGKKLAPWIGFSFGYAF